MKETKIDNFNTFQQPVSKGNQQQIYKLRAPKKVTKNMGEKKIAKRIRTKTFVKYVNLNHVMPTRYTLN